MTAIIMKTIVALVTVYSVAMVYLENTGYFKNSEDDE